ncbi:MAG: relA 1 [Pseudobdellovibrio sp.]|jgi:(p)ppGpp synthase/HD superfamily hydrolase|nr:relA 1 [Pseudobdellovibrio sp.]
MNTKLIWQASLFAADAHALQKRKSNQHAYFNHLLRVAHLTWKAGLSEEAVAAAFLHDTVEDTSVTADDIKKNFPERVAELVLLLTHWWPDDAPAEIKRTEVPKYYSAIAKDQEAIAIKLFDRSDNLREMARTVHLVPRWAAKYLIKSGHEMALILPANTNAIAKAEFDEAILQLKVALDKFLPTKNS